MVLPGKGLVCREMLPIIQHSSVPMLPFTMIIIKTVFEMLQARQAARRTRVMPHHAADG